MITLNRELFTGALERCARVAVQKSVQPQLAHVAIKYDTNLELLNYRATDERLTLMGRLDAAGKGAEFTANARDLLGAVQSLNGATCKLDVRKDHVVVTGELKRSFKVKTLDYADFPAVVTQADGANHELDQRAVDAINRVAFSAAADNDERAHLRSVRLLASKSKLMVVASDGKRAAQCFADYDGPDLAVTLPMSAVRLLGDVMGDASTVMLAASAGAVWFVGASESVGASVAEAAYPPVEQMFLNTSEHHAELDSALLSETIGAIRRADKEGDVIITLGGEGIRVESYGDGYGVDDLNVPCAPGQIGINSRYLLDALKCAGPTVQLGYGSDPLDPVSLTAGDWSALLMPLRMDAVRGKAKI